MMYLDLIGKQIADVREVAVNVMVLIMSDGSAFALESELFSATQYGNIYSPRIRELNEEELKNI